jgi:hypothetical protein
MPPPAEKRFPGCFVALFLLIWVPVTLVFDLIVVAGLVGQCGAWRYAATTGRITTSQVKTTSDGDGDSHTLDVRYEYAVNGQKYVGDRYRYGMIGTNDRTWKRVQKTLTVGGEVTVYYDPVNPAEATLTRGPMGIDLFMLNFLTPFNLVGLGMLAYLLRRKRSEFDPADRKLVEPTPTGWRLRLGARGGWLAFAVGWGFVAVVGLFAVVIPFGFDPPVWVAALPPTLGVGLGLWALLFNRLRVQAEGDDLNHTLTVGKHSVSYNRVRRFDVQERESKSEDGPSSFFYKCVLVSADPDAEHEVHEYTDRADADRLAEWLTEEISRHRAPRSA